MIERSITPQSALPYTALGALLLTMVLVPFVNAKPLMANMRLLDAIAQQPAGPLKNLEYFKFAIALDTYGTQEAREQLAQAASNIAGAGSFSLDIKQQFLSAAIDNMTAQEREMPSARFPLFLGVLYSAAGNQQKAYEALQRAHELSPKKQQFYFELAQNAFARGDQAAGLEFFKKAYELDTSFTEPRFFYAAALISAGRESEAAPLIAPYIETGEAADQRILAAYVGRGDYTQIVPIWEAKIKVSPQETQPYFTLAAVYYKAGDRVRAIQTLQKVKAAFPDLAAQVDSLIPQIQNGTVQI